MITETLTNTIILPDAPAIAGLTFRRFQGEADYPRMIAVLHGSKDSDQIEDVDSLETVTNTYAHLVNCDPYQDMLFIEMGGEVIGYTRVFWQEVADTGRLYTHFGFLLPQWRGCGIGRAMLRYNERRLREIALGHSQDQPKFFQVPAEPSETAKSHLLERTGYTPARYALEMVRPDLENIADCPVPAGLAVRRVRPEHYRAIWEANAEAFRDHWGYVAPTEEDYQHWLGDEVEFQPEIWKVAWDVETNQVAGMVLGFIHEEHNAKFGRRRGWTENICVRRPWRKRGLARALIAENLRELKARGMTEAALGVDAENLTGALRVYKSMGFQPVKRITIYRKPLG
jgi:mycothiol synthase